MRSLCELPLRHNSVNGQTAKGWSNRPFTTCFSSLTKHLHVKLAVLRSLSGRRGCIFSHNSAPRIPPLPNQIGLFSAFASHLAFSAPSAVRTLLGRGVQCGVVGDEQHCIVNQVTRAPSRLRLHTVDADFHVFRVTRQCVGFLLAETPWSISPRIIIASGA